MNPRNDEDERMEMNAESGKRAAIALRHVNGTSRPEDRE